MVRNRFSKERTEARQALVELLNLPDIEFRSAQNDPRSGPAFALAKRFIEKHGALRKADPVWDEAEAFEYARRFRQVWTDAKRRDFRAAEATLNQILTEGDPIKGESPVLTADIETGTIQREAKTLLHRLALELLYSRRALRRCRACGDFFMVQGGSRQQFCRNVLRDCKHEYRNESQKLLMRKRRDAEKEKKDAKRSGR